MQRRKVEFRFDQLNHVINAAVAWCVYVCVCVCGGGCMWLCMYVCMCVLARARVCVCANAESKENASYIYSVNPLYESLLAVGELWLYTKPSN